ncbi:MAG: hypothetical protein JNL66_12110 [Alphaproteobacteria bacterium]|nr:hypothetical protein [Alphaproteobacteria bacterium]
MTLGRAQAGADTLPEHPPTAAGFGARYASVSVAVIAGSCLFLQRFGVPFGEFKLHLATLTAFAVVAAGLAFRQVAVNMVALVIYLVFVAATLASGIVNIEFSSEPTLRRSMPSLLYFIGMYAPFVFRARRPISPTAVFRIIQGCLTVVAWGGILQFALQFLGLPLFSFQGFVPASFLVEEGYNVLNATEYGGSTFKSNGLFLLEASLFSQVMAIAIMLEVLFFKRVLALALFGVALFTALSGTGLMVLVVFFAYFAFGGGANRAKEVVLIAIFVGLFYLLATSVFSELGGYLFQRQGEFFTEGTSAYMRFVTPFRALGEILDRFPTFLLVGLGPGSAEALRLGFEYNMPTPGKVLIEYGLIVLALWIALILAACNRREWRTLFWPVLFLFFFTGGYQQLGPIVFLLFSLFAFAGSRPEQPR